jgi:hypothetical protein
LDNRNIVTLLVTGLLAGVIAAYSVAVPGLANTTTLTNTFTITGLSTAAMTTTVTTTELIGQGYWTYVTASCFASAPGGNAPCWGSGDPYIFNCTSEAATPQGCTQQVNITLAPYPSYTVNVKYPFANQSGPSWANCLWTVQGIIPGQGYAICIPITSNSFIMGEQGPPPV